MVFSFNQDFSGLFPSCLWIEARQNFHFGLSRHGERRSARKTPPHSLGQGLGTRRPLGGVFLRTGAILRLQPCAAAALPVAGRRSRRPGYKVFMTLPHRPGSAELPEMLAWSSTAAGLAVQASARPRITGSMLHAGRRRPPLACWCTTEEHAAHASPSSPEPARITY